VRKHAKKRIATDETRYSKTQGNSGGLDGKGKKGKKTRESMESQQHHALGAN